MKPLLSHLSIDGSKPSDQLFIMRTVERDDLRARIFRNGEAKSGGEINVVIGCKLASRFKSSNRGMRTVSTIRVSGWDHLIPPAYAGGTDCAGLISRMS